LLLQEIGQSTETLDLLWESIKIRVETYHWQQGNTEFTLHLDKKHTNTNDDGDEDDNNDPQM